LRFSMWGTSVARTNDFFKKMERLLLGGGNCLLLRELLDFDLKKVDVDEAPDTIGLLEQKIESLNPICSWWLSSLKEGVILNLDFAEDDWPECVGRQVVRDAFLSYSKQRGVRSWLPDASSFGRHFSKCCPGARSQRSGDRATRLRSYTLPTLKECRDQFELFIGHKLEWEDVEPNNVIDATNFFS